MSADLYIHSAKGLNEEDFRCFFSGLMGSKWFANGDGPCPWQEEACIHWKMVMNSPSVWIGEVSWLKQLFVGDGYVPNQVAAVTTIIGEDLPVLDDLLHDRILEALQRPNESAPQYRVTEVPPVDQWLTEHMGERIFTVSW